MKLLLHTCCGPCFLGVWEDLKQSDFEVTNYYYNPNIQPQEEYQKRKENLQKAVDGKTQGTIEEKYDAAEHLKAIQGEEEEFPKRCLRCYRLRLEKTAQKAKGGGFEHFSTTLLVSPYQNHEALREIGEELAQQYGVEFYYHDFRPHYRKGQNTAREMELYRQKYCGCLLSKEYR